MVSMTIIHKVIAILVSFFRGQLVGFGNPEVPGSNPAGSELQSNFFFFFQNQYFCNIYTFLTLFSQIGKCHKPKVHFLEGLFTLSVHCGLVTFNNMFLFLLQAL